MDAYKYVKYKEKYLRLKLVDQIGGSLLENRIKKYYEFNTRLSYLSNTKLLKKISKNLQIGNYGNTSTFSLDGEKFFCKQIKMTNLEYQNMFDSGNLFDLPTYYNYAIGSAGINCFRELLAHIKTTNWVLSRQIENFPLMYHYRFMQTNNHVIENNKNNENNDMNEKISNEIKKWDSNAVGAYVKARSQTQYSIVIILEHIPYNLIEWLDDYPRTDLYLEQIIKIVNFLHQNNIIHFDAHLGNILTDGKIIYLTDFGTVYDAKFKINENEKNFYSMNSFYDYGMVISNIFQYMQKILQKNIDKISYLYQSNTIDSLFKYITVIYYNLDDIENKVDIDERYLNMLKKYRKIIMMHMGFIYELINDPRKAVIYPNKKIEQQLLKLKII